MKRALLVLAPARARLATWWGALSPREQRLIAVFAALLLIAGSIQYVLRPLLAANLAARNDIRAYDSLNARLRAAGPAVGTQAPRRAGTPAGIVAASAAQAGLTLAVRPVTGGLQVALADMPYETVVRWLADIEATSPLRVRRAVIERRPAPGLVNAQVVLTE